MVLHLMQRENGLVRHQGGCHCGAVRFEVLAPSVLTVIDCNCSICVKKQNKYFLVPLNHFKLVSGHDALQTYTFNTHSAKHNFCSSCGVQPFFIPRSNPTSYGIAPHCLDGSTVKKINYEKVKGKNRDRTKQR